MKLLLDTSTFLWAILDDPQLSANARTAIEDRTNQIWVRAGSFWEISIKFNLGKLPLPDEPDRYLPKQRTMAGVDLLVIGAAEVCQMHRLPEIHRDPFDRLLVAQANCYGMIIVTNDAMIRQYPVQSMW